MEWLGIEPGRVELAFSALLLTTQDVLAPWAGDIYSFPESVLSSEKDKPKNHIRDSEFAYGLDLSCSFHDSQASNTSLP